MGGIKLQTDWQTQLNKAIEEAKTFGAVDYKNHDCFRLAAFLLSRCSNYQLGNLAGEYTTKREAMKLLPGGFLAGFSRVFDREFEQVNPKSATRLCIGCVKHTGTLATCVGRWFVAPGESRGVVFVEPVNIEKAWRVVPCHQ